MKRKEMANFICEEILKVYPNIRHEETLRREIFLRAIERGDSNDKNK